MSKDNEILEELTNSEYKHGWVTDIEADSAPKGLNEDIIRFISAKKEEPEWMLEWRLKAYRQWLNMVEPKWPNVHYPAINYQDIIYYSAPKQKIAPNSLDGPGEPAAGFDGNVQLFCNLRKLFLFKRRQDIHPGTILRLVYCRSNTVDIMKQLDHG